MSDDPPWYTGLQEAKKRAKVENFEAAKTADDGGWTKHTQWHWQRTVGTDLLDYWPSTQRVRFRGRTYRGEVATKKLFEDMGIPTPHTSIKTEE